MPLASAHRTHATPAYFRIYQELERGIERGDYQPNAPLPSQRSLSAPSA